MNFEIREVTEPDRDWIRALLRERWASETLVTRGRIHHGDWLPGFIAQIDEEPVGLVTYRIESDECEIVTLDALEERRGVGRALVQSVIRLAETSGCRRVWLVTTNDNIPAMRFYDRLGFSRVAVHRNAVEASRRLKPEIPMLGVGGVEIRDEVEYEFRIDS